MDDELAKIRKKKIDELLNRLQQKEAAHGGIVHAKSVEPYLEKSKDRLVVVDFYADWCGPCRVLGPILERLADEMGFLLVKINTDESPEEAARFGVRGIPSVFFLKGGNVVDGFVGARPVDFIRERVNKWLK